MVLGPGEVDFEGLDDGVDARSWQGVVLEEGEEAPLELEARLGDVNCCIEERPEPSGALAAGVAVEELGDRLRVEEAEDVCLLGALASACGCRTAARSKSVRAGVEVGIPLCVVTSSGWRTAQ